MDVSAHFSALDDEEFFVVDGSGWRVAGSLTPQVTCLLNLVHALAFIDKDIRHTSRPHHHHHNHHPRLRQVW